MHYAAVSGAKFSIFANFLIFLIFAAWTQKIYIYANNEGII